MVCVNKRAGSTEWLVARGAWKNTTIFQHFMGLGEFVLATNNKRFPG